MNPSSFTLRLLSAALGVLLAVCAAHAVPAAPPPGTPLLPAKASAITYIGPGDASVITKVVPVTEREFSEALRVDTMSRTDVGPSRLQIRLIGSAKKGDVVWISFQARALAAKRESGQAYFNLRVEQLVDGKYRWPSYIERGVFFGKEWTEVSIPYAMEADVTPKTMQVALHFDHYPQSFELSPITFLNCGPRVKVADLPRSVVKYAGAEPEAPWRAAAAARIEKHRKGDLAFQVVDSTGAPVADAAITVRMTRLDFIFGTAVDTQRILKQNDPDSITYRDTITRYFNNIVFENDMKWPRWADPKHNPEPLFRVLDWAREHNLTARGHCMVWPSWGKMPKFMHGLKDDNDALRDAVFKNIVRQTSAMKGRFIQWDVTNELYNHHDLVDIFGRDEIVAWYKAAHVGDPSAQLYYNDYTMFFPEAPAGPDHFYNTVKFLLDNGAPVQGIGEQAHIAGTPPAIPLVLARLEKFGGLGMPIMITEFDIASNDEDFQAAYTRDFMTAVFSSPAAVGFMNWGFWAGAHWHPNAALWNKDWSIRKHGRVFTDIVTREWRTDATGRTDPAGSYATRAFLGDYEVTVTHAGKTTTHPLKLTRDSGPQAIALP